MRIKSSWIKTITLPLALASLFACSDGAGSAPAFLDASGKHAPDWVALHLVEYNKTANKNLHFDPASSCAAVACHGADGKGGNSKVSCFSGDPRNGQSCHAGVLGHPVGWGDPTAADFHGFKASVKGATNLSSACGLCHATDSNGTGVGSAPSCLSTDPKWGISCHVSSPAVISTGCTSCHGAAAATGPNGTTAAPNRAFVHVPHLALAGVDCTTCHFGAGSGNLGHAQVKTFGGYTSATVRLDSSYNAKTGSFLYDYAAGTCSGVSCHGGQTTPTWKGGTLDIATECASCHQFGTTQFNSYNSGQTGSFNRHQSHMNANLVGPNPRCTNCHSINQLDTQKSGKHFSNLKTTTAETAASTTVGGSDTLVSAYADGNCTTSCHNPLQHNNSTTDNWYKQ